MAEENQDGQEKTEEPSQRKIDKHKEDGKVLSSKEMFVFTGIAGALCTGRTDESELTPGRYPLSLCHHATPRHVQKHDFVKTSRPGHHVS